MADDASDPIQELTSVLIASGVDPELASQLTTEGWTASTFAMCATSSEEFESVLSELCGGAPSLLQKAAMRVAQPEPTAQIAAAASTVSTEGDPQPSTASGSWVEAFAPKLEHSALQTIKSTFLANYPSEVLTPETMPSTRLLSLTHHQLKQKHWTWIPWRFRLTAAKADEISMNRTAKIPRLETQQLQALLVDDPPSIKVSNTGMGINAVRNLLDVHNTAIAMCGGAHLANLKAYSMKLLSFLTQRVDVDTGLRVPSILEAQAADRHCWQVIQDLMDNRSWSMDDSLHELTHIRHDLASFLQLRPRVPRAPPTQFERPTKGSGKAPTPSKGKGKGKSNKGKTNRPTWVTELQQDGQRKQLCMRFQSGRCSDRKCGFVHACAYPKRDGSACGGAHSAFDHRDTPH